MKNSKQFTIRQQLSRITPLSVAIVVLFAAAMTYFLIRSFAATGAATLYTSPGGSQSVATGQSFTVDVHISSPANVPVSGGSVYVTYPTDKLQVVSENYDGSPYSTLLVSDTGGNLRMDRAAFPALSGGDHSFAHVTFQAKAAGAAAISFGVNSIVTSGEDDTNILTQRTGVTYNIATPATPPPSSSGSGSASGSSGSHASGSAASSGSSKTPSGSASTTSPAGSSPASGESPTALATTTSDPTRVGEDTATDQSSTSSVEITILDADNKPVEGATVVIDGKTAKTDKNGVAHLDNVAAGDQTVAVSYNGQKTSKVLRVKGASTAASPELFRVSITKNKFNPILLILPVIILVAARILFLRPWGAKFANAHIAGGDGPVVVSSSQPVSPIEKVAARPPATPGTVYSPQSPDNPNPAPPKDPNQRS